MAQGHVHLDEDTFSCPVCLDLLREPVTIPCGHSCCSSCITHHWDRGDKSGIHSCPQCREVFALRPELRQNITLAAVVEQLKEPGVGAAPADHRCDAGAEGVACDVCTGSKLRQLSLTEDRRRFLQLYSSAWPLAASTGSSGLRIRRGHRRFEEVTAAVSESGQKIRRLLGDIRINISASEVELWPAAEPTTREELLRYSAELTLDPNTAHKRMFLSEGNTRATWMKKDQPRPHHPDRFSHWCQVLSRESLTRRCYWEVKVREGEVEVAVAYKNIRRAGFESGFGDNDKSWALVCGNPSYEFRFNEVRSEVWGPRSDTVGVYLDHAAGLLCFYSVASRSVMTLLHAVRTSFTQPLHAGLWLWPEVSSCELVKLG